MAEDNDPETFTFVDKRRTGSDSESESSAVIDQSLQSEPVDLDDDEQDFGPGDSLGSYGLAAYITGLIASDAWQKMGLITDPASGAMNRDLNQAKFSIDCVAAIVGQLESRAGVVPAKLISDLQRVLNDLRLNFIEQSRR
jgi:hypothetical protein